MFGIAVRLPALKRPPEWGVEPVPPELRTLGVFDLFVLWSSLSVGLLVLVAGSLLIFVFGLTLGEAIVVSVVGSVVGSVMLAAAAKHGSRYGVPTMVSLRPIVGRLGSNVASGLNALQLFGWATFELLVMGIAAAALTGNPFGPYTAALFVPMFGVVVLLLALGGPLTLIRTWLEKFAIWAVYASTAFLAIAIAMRGLDLGVRFVPATYAGTSSLLLALDLVIVLPISWWPLVADYNRFARSPRASSVGTALGSTVANAAFFILGAALLALAFSTNGSLDALGAIALIGLGGIPLLIILVDETDNAFANVYSTAVSIQNIAPNLRQVWLVAGATAVAGVGAVVLIVNGEGIGGGYESFLILIGGAFVPLLGIVIADSFVVRRGTYGADEFGAGSPRVRWPAMASWLAGGALYFSVALKWLPEFPPVGATLPSFALAAGLHIVLARLASTDRPAVSDTSA